MRELWVLAVSVLLNVSGQVSIKQSLLDFQSQRGSEVHFAPSTALPILLSPLTVLGLALYAASALFWMAALSRVQLSYAYPMLGAGYILVALVSWQLWGESMSAQRMLGTVVVAFGVYLVGTSS